MEDFNSLFKEGPSPSPSLTIPVHDIKKKTSGKEVDLIDKEEALGSKDHGVMSYFEAVRISLVPILPNM